jgi:polyphosphate kinase
MNDIDLQIPKLYITRELSFLEFNHRVLEQAKDSRIPLLERVKFLCISCANLDEFF